MRKIAILLLVLISNALPLWAQRWNYEDETASDVADAIRICLQESDTYISQNHCSNVFALPCQRKQPNYNWCIGVEAKAWQLIIKEEFQIALAQAVEFDKSMRKSGFDTMRAENLCKAQKYWLDYSKAHCRYISVPNGAGTIRTTYSLSCAQKIRSDRGLALRNGRVNVQGRLVDSEYRKYGSLSENEFVQKLGIWCDLETGEIK